MLSAETVEKPKKHDFKVYNYLILLHVKFGKMHNWAFSTESLSITGSALFQYSVSYNDICKKNKLQISNGKYTNLICFNPWDYSNKPVSNPD